MARHPLLYLHVGPHKTGTTSIQSFMRAQRADLQEAGISPWLEGGKANAARLGHAFLRLQLMTPMRLRKPGRKTAYGNAALAHFRRQLAKGTARTWLVSSETFCFARVPREERALRKGLSDLFDEIRPIIVLRNHADWKRSWMAQLEKLGVAEQVRQQPSKRCVAAPWYFDSKALAAFWARIGQVRIIDYDAAMRDDGSVLPGFLRTIGLPGLSLRSAYFENVSPSATANGKGS